MYIESYLFILDNFIMWNFKQLQSLPNCCITFQNNTITNCGFFHVDIENLSEWTHIER